MRDVNFGVLKNKFEVININWHMLIKGIVYVFDSIPKFSPAF